MGYVQIHVETQNVYNFQSSLVYGSSEGQRTMEMLYMLSGNNGTSKEGSRRQIWTSGDYLLATSLYNKQKLLAVIPVFSIAELRWVDIYNRNLCYAGLSKIWPKHLPDWQSLLLTFCL